MTGRQSNELVTSSVEKWGRRQYQGFHAFLGGDFKGGLDLPIRTGAQNLGLEIDDLCGLFKFLQLRRISRQIRVEKQTDTSNVRHHLVQERKTLAIHFGSQDVCACRVSTRPIICGDQTELDWIAANR